MTSTEADQRIILSRQTLLRYGGMTRAGQWPLDDLQLMAEEVAKLEEIAVLHPHKAQKVARLVESWLALQGAIRSRLN